jgi:hypothetical protein
MMFSCLLLGTLPTVPQHFVDRAINLAKQGGTNLCAKDYTQQGYLTRDVKTLDGTVTKSRHVESYAMGSDWEQWVKENIISEYLETGVRSSVGSESAIHGVHVDTPVKWKFFYLIEEGGENVITTFYLEKNHPAVRYGTPDNIVHSVDYSELVPIDAVHIPVNQWVFFDTRVMHGVENILSDRTMLVISVAPEAVTFEIKLTNKK